MDIFSFLKLFKRGKAEVTAPPGLPVFVGTADIAPTQDQERWRWLQKDYPLTYAAFEEAYTRRAGLIPEIAVFEGARSTYYILGDGMARDYMARCGPLNGISKQGPYPLMACIGYMGRQTRMLEAGGFLGAHSDEGYARAIRHAATKYPLKDASASLPVTPPPEPSPRAPESNVTKMAGRKPRPRTPGH